jgi:hypothetical protein
LELVDSPEVCKEVQESLRRFYKVLKTQQNSIRFLFITGVYKFSMTSIFSALNNLNDITFRPQYATLFGYTEKEVRDNFGPEIKKLGENYDETLSMLKENYNGYRFGLRVLDSSLSESVYNPFGLGCVFAKNDLVNKWYASGTPTFLIQKMSEKRNENYEFETADQTINYEDLEYSCSPDNLSVLSLLYYAGYATLSSYDKKSKEVTLMSPNKQISTSLNKDLFKFYTNTEDSKLFDLCNKKYEESRKMITLIGIEICLIKEDKNFRTDHKYKKYNL